MYFSSYTSAFTLCLELEKREKEGGGKGKTGKRRDEGELIPHLMECLHKKIRRILYLLFECQKE